MRASLPDSTLATLEKLQGQLPPHLARPELAELAVLMRYAERGAWAFAVYNTVPVRDEVAGVLRELLAPLPVYEFTLSPQQANPLDYLNEIPTEPERAIVFFFDLGQTDGTVWEYLEMQRENLAVRPLGLVFWINWEDWQKGVRQAPNFWSQRSGVFDFTIESPTVLTEVRGAWAGQPVRLEGPGDWQRQMRLFSGLLREYEAEEAPPATRAELHGKIAYLLYFADRHDEAAEHLQQQLALAQTADDQRQQVQAMNNLGRITQIQRGRLAALDWYERALTAAGDNPPARGESLQNIASALLWEGEADRAQAMLHEALALFRAVGARLGEANTLKAIGDVQQFRKEIDAALDSYQQALALFRAVGDRLGEANTLLALAPFSEESAEEVFKIALSLYEDIGDQYSLARGLYYYAQFLAAQGQPDKAIAALEQCRDKFLATNLRDYAAAVQQAINELSGQ
jgi:tetratricopeptide (TPR) repeat protein